MGNLGGTEILVIFIVALIVLGPKKLPEAARQIGKAMTEVRRVSSGFQQEFRDAIEDPVTEARAMARGETLAADRAPAPAERAGLEDGAAEDDTADEDTLEGAAGPGDPISPADGPGDDH